ncbi:MAG: lasso RiPP family leader peptide-containing protein [Gemmatimonadota bacterium]
MKTAQTSQITQSYQAPQLTQFGSFRELTLRGGGGCSDHPIGDAVACPTRS